MKLYVDESGPKPRLVLVDGHDDTRSFSFKWSDNVTWQDLIEILQELFPSE